MQECGDERNKGYKGADLNPHTFLKLDRLALADFSLTPSWQVHHKRIVKISLNVLDVLNVENLLTIGAKKVAGREFFFQVIERLVQEWLVVAVIDPGIIAHTFDEEHFRKGDKKTLLAVFDKDTFIDA